MDFVLYKQLAHALESGDDLTGLAQAPAANERDLLCTLLSIYELSLTGQAHLQHHPVIAEMRRRFEHWLVDALDVQVSPTSALPDDPIDAVRLIAERESDGIYDWVAERADWNQMIAFVAVEEPALASALHLPAIRREALPVTGLIRAALDGLLATDRSLQPELLGAQAVFELQAGRRCRRLVTALERLGALLEARGALYAERARTDDAHADEWLVGVLGPQAQAHPEWCARIVRGALWRSSANARLFRDLHESIATRDLMIA